MNDSVYSVIAYIARYWFALLVIIILWRAVVWLQKDADKRAREQSRLPDAGFIGEWVVLRPGGEMQEGMVLSAPREGWLGAARGCDVCIRGPKVPARAARFFLRRDGLHLQPQRRDIIRVDGEPVQQEAVMRHGATLSVGGITIQLRLFAGILLEGETILQRGLADAQMHGDVDGETSGLPTPTLTVGDTTMNRIRGTRRGKKKQG